MLLTFTYFIVIAMTQITTRLPDELVQLLDEAVRTLKRTRAEIVRRRLNTTSDFEDLSLAVERLRDLSDPVLE